MVIDPGHDLDLGVVREEDPILVLIILGNPSFGARVIDLGLLCLLIWVLAGLALLGAAVFRDALRTWPSGP